ncbi:DUF4144 family protein [Psychrobium sp. 1_MG-2023]|uniref:DUF4144 family protein n=1 Tax=Psychrobium sp. 1_MG-2023 TaxID=3062624 RepID=UPI0026C17A2F|nr:DUF4144 family protein [Psychrobium sp. 1_MG-2023]MDP2562893.1 DUF4144 family protein [Psychrobium sp. 1_MG-2023]
MLKWPVVVKYQRDVELFLLDNQTQWNEHHLIEAQPPELIIDSCGDCFQWHNNSWRISDDKIRLEHLVSLIRYYAQIEGHCCTAKLGAKDYQQAFEIIAYLNQQ